MTEAFKEYIIVADDLTSHNKLMEHYLNSYGFGVISVRDGENAFYVLNESEKKIVAVFSDLMMPKLDGVELLKKLKQDQRFQHLPFIAVTSVDHDPDFLARLMDEEGLSGFVLKPIREQAIQDVLRKIFPELLN